MMEAIWIGVKGRDGGVYGKEVDLLDNTSSVAEGIMGCSGVETVQCGREDI